MKTFRDKLYFEVSVLQGLFVFLDAFGLKKTAVV